MQNQICQSWWIVSDQWTVTCDQQLVAARLWKPNCKSSHQAKIKAQIPTTHSHQGSSKLYLGKPMASKMSTVISHNWSLCLLHLRRWSNEMDHLCHYDDKISQWISLVFLIYINNCHNTSFPNWQFSHQHTTPIPQACDLISVSIWIQWLLDLSISLTMCSVQG